MIDQPAEPNNLDPDEAKALFQDLRAREAAMREFGEMTFSEMVASFACLEMAPIGDPFDAVALDDWAVSGASTGGTRVVAQFVLRVFNSDTEWKCGRFDIVDVWKLSAADREVIIRWVANPVRP